MKASMKDLSAISLMSAPAAKALSEPVIRMQPMASSASNASIAAASSPISAELSALSACGRLRRMMPTWPLVSTRMCLIAHGRSILMLRDRWKIGSGIGGCAVRVSPPICRSRARIAARRLGCRCVDQYIAAPFAAVGGDHVVMDACWAPRWSFRSRRSVDAIKSDCKRILGHERYGGRIISDRPGKKRSSGRSGRCA